MTKNDYKRLCKKGRTKSYRLRLAGIILAFAGLAAVAAGYFMVGGNVDFSTVLLIMLLGFALVLAGVITDLIGELLTAKGYKAYLNGRLTEAFNDMRGGFLLENQNGELRSFSDADILNYLEEMFICPGQFVCLTAPSPINKLRFVQATMHGKAVELQLGVDTGGSRLVYKLCSKDQCRRAFLDFYGGCFRPDLHEYQPVEYQ